MGGICSTRGKSKVVRVHAVKESRGSRGGAPFIHKIGASTEVCGQRRIPAAFPPGNNPGTCLIGSWVCPGAFLDFLRKRKYLAHTGI